METKYGKEPRNCGGSADAGSLTDALPFGVKRMQN